MKYVSYLFSIIFVITTLQVEAKNPRNNKQKQQQQKALAAEKKKEAAERAKKDKINLSIDEVMKNCDKNNDRSLTLEEFTNGSGDRKSAQEKFSKWNKNHDRYLSRTEVQSMLGF
jgi:hypothetical protein